MEKLRNFLSEFGFGRNEISVYLALLTMKETTVLEISKKTGLHRSNIYEALNLLSNRGLVFSFEDPVKKYYAKNPESLLKFIKSKELEFESILKELKNKISIHKEGRIGKSKGKAALIEALSGLIKLNKPICVYGMKKDTHKIIGPSARILEKDRIKKEVKIKIIYDSDSDSVMKTMDRKKFTKVKSLPQEYNSDITTWVCGDKVLIVNWAKDISVTEIEDQEIAKSYAQYFNLLWSGAKCEVCVY